MGKPCPFCRADLPQGTTHPDHELWSNDPDFDYVAVEVTDGTPPIAHLNVYRRPKKKEADLGHRGQEG